MQWHFCAARGAIIGAATADEDSSELVDAATMALGAASLAEQDSMGAAAAYSSEPCARVVL